MVKALLLNPVNAIILSAGFVGAAMSYHLGSATIHIYKQRAMSDISTAERSKINEMEKQMSFVRTKEFERMSFVRTDELERINKMKKQIIPWPFSRIY